MPKKSSSKVATMAKEEPDVLHEKPETTSKEKDEIDEIFSTRKRKNPEMGKAEKPGEMNEKTNLSKKKKKKKKKKKSLKESVLEPDSKPRRRTNDGLSIYTAEELGVNKQDAGGTPLCPFDCSCCF